VIGTIGSLDNLTHFSLDAAAGALSVQCLVSQYLRQRMRPWRRHCLTISAPARRNRDFPWKRRCRKYLDYLSARVLALRLTEGIAATVSAVHLNRRQRLKSLKRSWRQSATLVHIENFSFLKHG